METKLTSTCLRSATSSMKRETDWLRMEIHFLVYKQSGRIDFEDGQWGCEPQLGMRVANKEELAEKYSLGEPVAGNMIYTKYSPAGTDYLLCKLTRCEANPRGGPFPIPLPGINDGPECQSSQ